MEKEELDSYILAGKINSRALDFGSKLIKPGASMIYVLDEIEKFIIKEGAVPAFPAQISLNNIAAHYCPAADDLIINEGDIAKLDIGVAINGYVADSARTIDLGNNGELSLASKKALANALKILRPGVQLGEIGQEIQDTIASYGFTPIKNLSGHGLARFTIHSAPSIPNIATGSQIQLKENQVIAIEPFATNGTGLVYEGGQPTVFSMVANKPVRSPAARKVLADIKKYEGLPFASRWLIPKHGVAATQLALREMGMSGIVHAHPPLLEKGKGMVAQWEHSVIIKEKPIVYTKHDDD